MPDTPPRQNALRRAVFILLWTGLVALAAVGVFFTILTLAGVIEFALRECGPRSDWSELNYSACSDIDEAQPLFLGIALITLAPIAIALVIRRAIGRVTPPLFVRGTGVVIGKIIVTVWTAAALWFFWQTVLDIRLALSLCPSEVTPDPCPMQWKGTYVPVAITVTFLIPACVFLLRRKRCHAAVTSRR